MNLFFGVAAKENTGLFEKMCSRVEHIYDVVVERFEDRAGKVHCGYVCDKGSVLGKASIDGCFLVYSGLITSLGPGVDVSAMDAPDTTAAIMLSRYMDQGLGFLDDLSGQFAVVLFDASSSVLVVSSDSVGQRRLFYTDNHGEFIFATHLILLATGFDGGVEIDRSLEDFLLGFEFMPFNRTVYNGVTYLGPGEVIEVVNGQICSRGAITKGSDPAIEIGDYDAINDVNASRRLYEVFMSAVESQCPSTSDLAVLLGGFDSALVAAALTRIGKRVETFTFGFDDKQLNQPNVETLRRHLGCHHTWVPITEQVIINGLRNYSLWFNQPASQAHYPVQTAFALSNMREHGHTHCFSGDGCDELFLGYPMIYRRAQLFLRFGVLPARIRNLLMRVLCGSYLERHLGHSLRMARNVITVLGRKMPSRGHIAHRILDECSLEQLRIDEAPVQECDIEVMLAEIAARHGDVSPIRLAYLAKAAVGVNRNRNEGATCQSGVSIRSPFQDATLRQFVSQLPDSMLRPEEKTKADKTGKYILMKMAEEFDLLPTEVIYQAKASPVTAPVDGWYMGPLREQLLDLLKGLPFRYDHEYVSALLHPKMAENLYRRNFTIGRYAMHAMSMLVTYASYTRYGHHE